MRAVLSSISLPLVLLAVACGSDSSAGPGGSTGATGGAGGAGGANPAGAGGDVAAAGAGGERNDVDAAPGQLRDIELSVDGDQYTFSWELPPDEDLADLRFLVVEKAAEPPAVDDAEALELEDTSVVIANLVSGTEYVAYFFLSDEAGSTTLSTFAFVTAGAPPVESVFALGLRGSVFLRWTNPPSGFEKVVVRQAAGAAPTSVSEGDEVYSGIGGRVLVTSIIDEAEYGHLLYTVNAEEEHSDFRTASVTTTGEHGVVVDASAECDSYGYRIGTTGWSQTFTRGSAGEDVLTGIEVALGRKGNPTVDLGVQVLEDGEYLWSNNIYVEDIPEGTNWVLISANGKGVTNVNYELLEPGKQYEIKLWSKAETSDTDYFTWKSSNGDCYEGGEGVSGRDFHFRTIHATAGDE